MQIKVECQIEKSIFYFDQPGLKRGVMQNVKILGLILNLRPCVAYLSSLSLHPLKCQITVQ